MRTVIVTGLAITWSVPLLLGYALLARGMMWRVTDFIRDNGPPGRRHSTALSAGIWLFAAFSMLATLAPVPLYERAAAIVMMSFLLQAGITDALSGYLPRTFTARLLLAGVLWGMMPGGTPAGVRVGLLEGPGMGNAVVVLNGLGKRRGPRL